MESICAPVALAVTAMGRIQQNQSNLNYYLTGMRISCDCFANFVADFRMTFVRVSHQCRDNFLVSRTSRELVAKFLRAVAR